MIAGDSYSFSVWSFIKGATSALLNYIVCVVSANIKK